MTMGNLMQFNMAVDNFARNIVPRKAVLLQKKVVLEALRRIIMKTPVDTGRARGNWQVTIGQPAPAAIELLDKAGSQTISNGLAAIDDLPPFSTVWISNNVNYIEYLEEGSSKQAPAGMVSLTIVELRQIFERGTL